MSSVACYLRIAFGIASLLGLPKIEKKVIDPLAHFRSGILGARALFTMGQSAMILPDTTKLYAEEF